MRLSRYSYSSQVPQVWATVSGKLLQSVQALRGTPSQELIGGLEVIIFVPDCLTNYSLELRVPAIQLCYGVRSECYRRQAVPKLRRKGEMV